MRITNSSFNRMGICIVLLMYISIGTVSAGTIVAWGNDVYGQKSGTPIGNDYVAISAGEYHNLALKSDGSIAGWGDNANGQASPPSGNDFVAISAGYLMSCALRSDGSIVRWGVPGTVPAGNDFIAIDAGYSEILALRSDGSIVGGATGTPAGNDFVAIANGAIQSAALRSDGSIVSWGDDFCYDGSVPLFPTPTGNNFIAISAGGDHLLALRSDGSIEGWGCNWDGQINVPEGNDYIAISAGSLFHSSALRSDGSIVEWENQYLDATPSGYDFIAISDGGWHGLALKNDGMNTIHVPIDIKPGTCLNSFKVGNNGNLPVAILGTEDFDASNINSITVLLEGIAPIKCSMSYVDEPFNCDSDCESCNCWQGVPDRYPDLICHFNSEDISRIDVVKNAQPKDFITLTLTAETNDERAIVGEDCLQIVKNKVKI